MTEKVANYNIAFFHKVPTKKGEKLLYYRVLYNSKEKKYQTYSYIFWVTDTNIYAY